MKTIMQEYAGAVVGLVGAVGFLLLIGNLFYSETGFFAEFIQNAVEGG